MTALADLLVTNTVTQIFQLLLGQYQAAGFPVQSWQTGGVERTRLMAIATVLADVSGNYIPTIAGAGFLDYAETDWLRLTASQTYSLPYNAASQTKGTIRLTAAAGAGPYTIVAGDLIAAFGATGNRYINNAGGVLAAGPSTLDLSFTAEFAGSSYADPSSSGSISLVNPLPGVTMSNVAGNYSAVTKTGAGTGTVSPSGSPVGSHQVIVRIDSSGAAGVAGWSYSLDGAPYVSAGVVASLANLGGYGITVTLVDGGSGTSFVTADTHYFTTPGTWITTQGSDDESDAALIARCKARWPSLSSVPTKSYYQLLATSVPSVGSQVTQVIVLPDSVINNKVNVIVAGPVGALPGATLTAIQSYLSVRAIGTDTPVVVSPSTLNVTLAATVTVSGSQLTAAQTAIQSAMTAYALGVGINGTIRVSVIIEKIMEVTGVVDVSGVTINGAAANLTLGSSTTFVVGSLQALSFSYVTV